MKQITLPAIPEDTVIFEYPQREFDEKCEFFVPAGFEAVVRKGGILSDLYREGDCICLGVKTGLLGRKVKDFSETVLYICRKNTGKPIKWGTGDIPYYGAPDKEAVRYGCNGTLKISVQNAVKLIRNIAGCAEQLNARKIGQCLEAEIVAKVRAQLTETVQKSGLQVTPSGLEQLATSIKDALFGVFDNDGIRLESFIIAEIIVTKPSGQDDR